MKELMCYKMYVECDLVGKIAKFTEMWTSYIWNIDVEHTPIDFQKDPNIP